MDELNISVSDLSTLLSWGSTQSHILTGNGLLSIVSTEGKDFEAHDLPHSLIRNRISKRTFKDWLKRGKVSYAIMGCWYRPIFSGGWMESNDTDTLAYNIQTPSIFIDMRFPSRRPSEILMKRGSLSQCSDIELKILARQHCFAGYTYPEESARPLLFTRHHVIDWNYHPRFPRNRPNRWWVELNAKEDSFKEFSFARDSNNVPIYFERWARFHGDSNGKEYLALRKITSCPFQALAEGKEPQRDGILVVMGDHFALAIDRSIQCPNFESFIPAAGQGTGPGDLIDHALSIGHSESARADVENFLDLTGCYGQISYNTQTKATNWTIIKSTKPWLEGSQLFSHTDVKLKWDDNPEIGSINELQSILWDGAEWEVLECSLNVERINSLFLTSNHRILISKI